MFKELSKFLIFLFFTPFFKIRIKGRENIPSGGPLILCSNHVTMLDMFFIGYRIRRWIYWMAKEELFRIPVFSTVLRNGWGAFPVKRGRADINSIKTAIMHLRKGHIVGIFPQGTRSGKTVRPGAAALAVRNEVPVIPVAIKGGNKLFGKVTVLFGKPFKLTVVGKADKKEMKRLSGIIMERIYGLLEEIG